MKIITSLFLICFAASVIAQQSTELPVTQKETTTSQFSQESIMSLDMLHQSLKGQFEFIFSNSNFRPLITREILLFIKEHQKDDEVIVTYNDNMSIRIFPRSKK